ncbi:MAG: inositol monophosphatase family protein [Chloroflexi bacterium]|nr:inositol monophosphatase family protein [Chloroflexota bacterium]MCH8817078.1 inositol monophosphatase family protein [Chloroflexota bacterium]
MTEFNRGDALLAAVTACGAAAGALLARFRDAGDSPLERSFKSDGSLVTDADIAADRAIAEVLGTFDVAGQIVSEESISGAEDSDLRWLVDPLCGTAPYAAGLGHWGVNVALMDRTRPLLGAITVPTMRETLTSVCGRGVSRNGKPWSPQPPPGKLSEQLVDLEIDGPDRSAAMMADGSLRWVSGVGRTTTYASMAYPLGQLCLGRLAGVVAYGVGTVHLAAGLAIAEELGVTVTDGNGDALDWTVESPWQVMIAAWPDAHAGLLELMHDL